MVRRKYYFLIALLIGLPVLFLVWRFYWLRWTAEKLILSKETTYVTEPLDEAGYPDYYAALNERMSVGVTPENNAAALLLQALGPSILPEDIDRDKFYLLLRMKPLPRSGRYFEDWVTYGKRLPPKEIPNLRPEEPREHEDRLWLIDTEIAERPWGREEFPQTAKWLDAQQEYLDLMVAASKRPRLFAPIVRQSNTPLMMLHTGTMFNAGRSSLQALSTRARYRMGEREFRGAWDDLMACHRLARLFGQGPMIFDTVMAKVIDAAAFEPEAELLGAAELDAEEWAIIRAEFNALPALPSFAEKLDLGERFAHLDAICVGARRGIPVIERAFYGEPENWKTPTPFAGAVGTVDWNTPLQMTNDWIDRYVEAAQIANPLDQSAAFTALDWEAQASSESAAGKWEFPASVLSRSAASERMGRIFIGIFFSSLARSDYLEERSRAVRPLVRVGLALARYKADNGSYPRNLQELVPNYLDEVPADPYRDGPFRYRPTDNGYRLYSVGWNGKDDRGKGHNNEDQSDDVLIEVPWKPKAKPLPADQAVGPAIESEG